MSTLADTKTTEGTQVAPISKLWWVGLAAAVASALGNVIVYGLGALLSVPWFVPAGPGSTELMPLPIFAVILFSAVPAIVATIIYAILGKFLARPILIFWIISIVFLLVSFFPVITLPENVFLSTRIGLSIMHVVAGGAIVGILTIVGRKK